MCQCRLMDCYKRATLVGGVGNGGGCAYMGTKDTCEISVPSSCFCCEPKNALKK